MPYPKFDGDHFEILVTELIPSSQEIDENKNNEEIKNTKEFFQVAASLGHDILNSTPKEVLEFLSEARKTLKK